MLPSNIQWFFPSNPKEASRLIRKRGHILHAGGTKILEPQPRGSIKGLVEVSGLELNYIRSTGSTVHFGAGASFADVVAFCRRTKKFSALGDSLSVAASTPLRNRITVGGSVRDFPLWSNLYAPLLALDARVQILGARSGVFSLEEYASSSLIKTNHLVVEVRVTEQRNVRCASTSFHILRFEYPMFCIAAALKLRGARVEASRIFVTGVKKKLGRLSNVEQVLFGNDLTESLIETAGSRATFAFAPDFKFSSAYKEKMAKVYLVDLLSELRRTIS